ncbi:hypothetical protein RRG08_048169 [Elysia crispata]|uniref:Paraoxonase n=1 Tax=Elysia crispata TaxID=231223 RepID=A0AAE0ZIC0_9GAST|nr:hypothetical protein RRG08_048169 [Elysia crispata]
MLSQAVLVAAVAAACYGVYHFSNTIGLVGNYYNHRPGICRRVPGIEHGSEDIHVTSDGKAFVSSGFLKSREMKEYAEKHKVKGRVFLFDFKKPSAGAVELGLKAGRDFDAKKFRPHGLSVLEDKKRGEHLVYVVSHPDGLPDVVEKFRFSPKSRQLIHVRSIPVGDKLVFTNDLALISEDQFYITNMAVFHFAPLAFLEKYLPLRTGAVFFYNGTEMQEVIPNLSLPNGVFLSSDHKMLYVVSFCDKTLMVYRLDPITKGAQLLQTVQLFGRGDNVQLTQSGDALLLGAHPNFLQFRIHEHSPTPADINSPSSVVRLPLDKDNLVREADVTEMFYDHGDLISGSSVAAIFEGQMLIGSVVDSLVHCELFTQAKS